ncbi:M15 family metallopeptidase [Jeotgalibacillus marinus]|uniref:D-alanyl-D-alanine carboxypeptidase family protein n=1 Tax=Jeotgalibacillus marinus TaxID=86667 RepID=A0ABV3Q6I2_9BACL
MKKVRLFSSKKMRPKWWITLAVTSTILVGASLGTLSMYNWSFNQAIQGLFHTTKQPSVEVAAVEDKEQPAPSDEGPLADNEKGPRLSKVTKTETPDPAEEELDDVTPSAEEEDEETPETIVEPAPSKDNEKNPTSPEEDETPDPSEDELDDITPPTKEEDKKTPETIVEPTYVQGVLISNKQYPLPATYAPGESAEARGSFAAMRTAAATEGFDLIAFSTYRSYDHQVGLYQRYVDQYGQSAADRFSAQPGYSEHQTGLAFDIGEVGQEAHWAEDSFKDTATAKWLNENAHDFGFILRYPPGKEHITGYQYESWHFRYLGVDLATKVYNSGLTLEEYLNI